MDSQNQKTNTKTVDTEIVPEMLTPEEIQETIKKIKKVLAGDNHG